MTDFIIKKLPYDLGFHTGLAFTGKYLKSININSLIDPVYPVRCGIPNSDTLKTYPGLLCLGKNDFDAVENFRDNAFFNAYPWSESGSFQSHPASTSGYPCRIPTPYAFNPDCP